MRYLSCAILLILSITLPLTVTYRDQAVAQENSRVVRTLVYRDLMPATITEEIENFAWAASPVISADGSTAVYSISRPDGPNDALVAHVYRFDIESRTETEVDATTQGPQLDISDDGQTILTMHQTQAGGPRLVRIADGSGARTIVENSEVYLTEAVLSGDGQTVLFVMSRDSPLVGVDSSATGGIWAINADGSDLRHLVGAEDVRPLMNAEPEDQIFFSGYPYQSDISSDGSRIVFAALNFSTGEYIGFGYQGGDIHVLHGPSNLITRLAISGDGSTVLSLVSPYPAGSGPGEYIVSGFDGSDRLVLTSEDKVGTWYARGTMLTEDGSQALLGGTGLLYDTATGEAITLAVGCPPLSGSELPYLTMDATGSRFLYLGFGYQTVAPLTLLELDPAEIPADVPVISNVSIDPPVVTAGDQASTSTISARIEADGVPANCVHVLNGTLNESRTGVSVAGEMLYDGGSATAGDETAGDGTYTNNSLHANEGMPSGPRTVRIKAEVQDTEGYRWAIAVDFEPFSVDGVAPAGDTATIEATPPDASDEPTDSAGGPPASDQGDDAAQGSGDWSEWEGAPEPEECTAPAPTADELIKTLIAAAAEPPDTSVIPAQVDTEAEVPAGEPVDEETAAVALDTLHQLAACTNAGHPAFFGLFTPNGIASLFVYFGLPLQPLTEEAIQDLEENIGTALAEPPTPVAEGERSGITEIRDVRLLEDGRVLVLVLADFPNGELLGYLVLVEEDDRWLIDALGIVGEPIEIELGF